MLTIAMLSALLLVTVLGAALALWACARLVRAGSPSFRRALACSLVLAIMGFGVQLAFAALSVRDAMTQIIVTGAQLVIALALTWWITAWLFRITFPRAMLLSLPYFALTIPATVGTVYVVKEFCLEAFVIPTNSMAPILFGWHHETTCPHCKGTAIVPGRAPDDPDPFFERNPPDPKPGICAQCRKISEFEKWPPALHTPVRMICTKWMDARRGDAIVFVPPIPHEPNERRLYIMRLVGLPGEKIEIKGGSVWINGAKWEPPAELSGLTYEQRAGVPDDPLRDGDDAGARWELGPDEFFVLGDFTRRSSDSREWGPVPRRNLVGVASVIYWPPSAWRILR